MKTAALAIHWLLRGMIGLTAGLLTLLAIASLEKMMITKGLIPWTQPSEIVPVTETTSPPAQSEISKIFGVLDHYKQSSFRVLYEGHEYPMALALPKAKQYILQHFNSDQRAEEWVKKGFYRSQSTGQIIYLKFPDGKLRPLRDVLIEKLDELQRLAV